MGKRLIPLAPLKLFNLELTSISQLLEPVTDNDWKGESTQLFLFSVSPILHIYAIHIRTRLCKSRLPGRRNKKFFN